MGDESEVGSWIAVIGASGRFPGASTLGEYWNNLRHGVESVRRFTDEELLAAGESPEALSDPAYVRAWPVLDGVEMFDAAFFGMSPRDAAIMDPQHRLFLEVAWHAMEDAGYDPEQITKPVGVFAACGQNTYMMYHLVNNEEVMNNVGEWLVRHTGNDMNFLATRVSYQMNLKGPSMNVQTACSSSLVAVHLAFQSLHMGECDMALAGASTVLLPQDRGYLWKQGEIMSADGHCRPFDAESGGTVFGSGVGCVVLKRLSDAIKDGDHVRAIIRGSAINNDGATKVGYLAPSVEGQAAAIAEAIAISDVDAESIMYLEAHGTATAIGDPIEVAALTQAFGEHTQKKQFCAMGSVKANIGHLGEAAGMASLIKVMLALEHGELPPSINYDRPNREIDFADSPVFVNQRLTPWVSKGPRRAGITALGAGGTNAHLVLEQAPELEPSGPSRSFQLLAWSARTAEALEHASENLAAYLKANPEVPLADVAYTLHVGRKQHAHRRMLVCAEVASAAEAIASRDPKRVVSHAANRSSPTVVFMFPGGGAQYPGAGEELYRTEPAYRAAFDECLAAFEPAIRASLTRLVLARGAAAASGGDELTRPLLSVCSVFVIEYAMAKLLLSWGLEPDAMIGHSMGEYVAACLSSVMALKDAAALLTLRGQIFESVPPGAMLSVPLPEAELVPLLGSELSIAAVNGPELCVASGPISAIEALEKVLSERQIECTRVHIAVAAHSAMLNSSLPKFERLCRSIRFGAPQIPFMSNLTGTWIRPDEASDPSYWVRHLRNTVRFGDGISGMLQGASRVFLEVGPGRTLSSLARSQGVAGVTALPTLRHPREQVSDVDFLLQCVGRLSLQGIRLAWSRFYEREKRLRLPLPLYPFDHQRFWVDRVAAAEPKERAPKTSALRKKSDIADWFYLPTWKPELSGKRAEPHDRWLVFCDSLGIGEELAAQLPGDCVRVVAGFAFEKRGDYEYMIRPGHASDYLALFELLRTANLFPGQIVHLWAITGKKFWQLGGKGAWEDVARFEETRERCFESLLFIAQALSKGEEPVVLSVVSNDLHALGDESIRLPARALLNGPVRVIPREMPQVRTRHIDVRLSGRRDRERVVDVLVSELALEPDAPTVLRRGQERWSRSYERTRIEPEAQPLPALRPGGTYLITGGLGGIGLEVAEHFARECKARLVLIGRSPVPDKADWDRWIARHGDADRTSQRIRKLRAIEALGGEVLALSADVADQVQMTGALTTARERFGPIHGAVHAAGVIDDGLLALKTREAADAVIVAKAKGALLLCALLPVQALDFVLLFSSVSSILGLEGQIDYTAANAVLDAVGEQAWHEGGARIVSVGWNAWQGVGMAVSLADKPTAQQGGPASVRGATHPMLSRIVVDKPAELELATQFSRAQHWLLSEHVVRGADALIPGTGYLELARAALELRPENRAVELRDVFFLSPFSVRLGESRELHLRVQRSGSSGGEFTFFSERSEAPHVTGRMAYVDAPPARSENIEAIARRCTRGTKQLTGFLEQRFMDFGPRWGNMKSVAFGESEALVRLELPDEYAGDLAIYRLHPALLDMATGGAQALTPGFDQEKDFYVPFSYGAVLLRRGLPAKVASHVRFNGPSGKDIISFDVDVYDENGEEVLSIKRFVMKRVDLASVLKNEATRTAPDNGNMSRVGAAVHQGILPAEGMVALDRILGSALPGRVVASSVDLHAWAAAVDAEAQKRSPAATDAPDSIRTAAFARPTLAAAYVAPRDDVERALAELWRDLLGVDQVGIHDDFFELGGQSLIAVRLFNRIRKKFGVDLPISTLFQAPTIAECSAIVREEAGLGLTPDAAASANGAAHADAAPEPHEAVNGSVNGSAGARDAVPDSFRAGGGKKTRWSSLVPMQREGKARPFFCVAGMGGTVNNLYKLALLLGEKRPVYGLQPPGAEDETKRLYTVEDLATHYIQEIRAVQPTGPYLLGGYSGGGVVAFEMSRQLEVEGEQVAFLGFLDSFSPALPTRPFLNRAQIHLKRAQDLGPSYLLGSVRRRLFSETATLKLQVARQLGRVFKEKYRYEALQDAWVVAERSYKPLSWSGSAVLFRAREESAVSRWTGIEVDEQHGWGRYVRGGVQVVICPGDHTTICEEPYVRTLAQKLKEAMELATVGLDEERPVPSVPVPSSASAPLAR